MPPDAWSGTSLATAKRLVSALPAAPRSRALRDLQFKVLVSRAHAAGGRRQPAAHPVRPQGRSAGRDGRGRKPERDGAHRPAATSIPSIAAVVVNSLMMAGEKESACAIVRGHPLVEPFKRRPTSPAWWWPATMPARWPRPRRCAATIRCWPSWSRSRPAACRRRRRRRRSSTVRRWSCSISPTCSRRPRRCARPSRRSCARWSPIVPCRCRCGSTSPSAARRWPSSRRRKLGDLYLEAAARPRRAAAGDGAPRQAGLRRRAVPPMRRRS